MLMSLLYSYSWSQVRNPHHQPLPSLTIEISYANLRAVMILTSKPYTYSNVTMRSTWIACVAVLDWRKKSILLLVVFWNISTVCVAKVAVSSTDTKRAISARTYRTNDILTYDATHAPCVHVDISGTPWIKRIPYMTLFWVVAARCCQMHLDTVKQLNPSYPKSESDLEGMKHEVITWFACEEWLKWLIVSSPDKRASLTYLVHSVYVSRSTAEMKIWRYLSHPLDRKHLICKSSQW